MNRDHVDIGPAAVDLGVGLPAGRFLAQVGVYSDDVLYATAENPPADLADWFYAERLSYFTFTASATCPMLGSHASDQFQ